MSEPYLPPRYVLTNDGRDWILDPYEMRSVADLQLEASGRAPVEIVRVWEQWPRGRGPFIRFDVPAVEELLGR